MSNELPIRVVSDVVSSPSPENVMSKQPVGNTISSKERYPAVDDVEKAALFETPGKEENADKAEGKVNDAEKERILSEYVQKAQSITRDLEFSIDEELDKTIITVYDAETEEVIRKIPSEEALGLARALKNNDGVLLKVKA